MALFSADTINEWLDDFRELGHRIPMGIRTLERDLEVDGGLDSGLVLIEFQFTSAEAYLERPSHEQPQWCLHIGARDEELRMFTADVFNLTDELQTVARLSAYLEARTAEALARS